MGTSILPFKQRSHTAALNVCVILLSLCVSCFGKFGKFSVPHEFNYASNLLK